MVAELKREVYVKHIQLQAEMNDQREGTKNLCEGIEGIKYIATGTNCDREQEHSEHAEQQTKPKDVNTEELKEDLLNMYYESGEPKSHDDSINSLFYLSDDDNTARKRYRRHQKRMELEARITEIKKYSREN
ncbi:hypothetical protein V3C99_018730 [Haemonchus contortus]|uniref:BZIP domain-containing protein n=1 Tax=Haemonchus contortus TaxID=6289 RepID=A0A7I4Z3X2_HAECO